MLNRPSSENKKNSTPLELHNVSSAHLKQIEQETRGMKPCFNSGEFVILRKDIKQNEYVIPRNSVCWVEQIRIFLDGEELLSPPAQNNYKIYYVLLYEYIDTDMFSDNKVIDLEEELELEPPEGYIDFLVEESDLKPMSTSS